MSVLRAAINERHYWPPESGESSLARQTRQRKHRRKLQLQMVQVSAGTSTPHLIASSAR